MRSACLAKADTPFAVQNRSFQDVPRHRLQAVPGNILSWAVSHICRRGIDWTVGIPDTGRQYPDISRFTG